MRFAPPKSAPPDHRKHSKDAESELRTAWDISGWSINTPQQDDFSLLSHSIADTHRRCSSATTRTTNQLIVNFNRVGVMQQRSQGSKDKDSLSYRPLSKDSGVETVADEDLGKCRNQERGILGKQGCDIGEEDAFSDLSDSDSDNHEIELARLGISDGEYDYLTSDTDSKQTSSESRDGSRDGSRDTSREVSLTALEHNINGTVKSESPLPRPRSMNYPSSSTPPATSSKRRVKKCNPPREHQMPNPVTPDIPESPVPMKQQIWSRSRKLERHSTSPSVPSFTDMVYDFKKDQDQLLTNQFDNVLQANRPTYRNDRRRNSSFKSSCSIPSFSTPTQALLLIGMKPDRQQDSNKVSKKASVRGGFPRAGCIQRPVPAAINRNRDVKKVKAVVALPALSVNGAGDLVIRKKQIISG